MNLENFWETVAQEHLNVPTRDQSQVVDDNKGEHKSEGSMEMDLTSDFRPNQTEGWLKLSV